MVQVRGPESVRTLAQYPKRRAPACRFQSRCRDREIEGDIPRPFEMCSGLVWTVESDHSIPERGGRQEGMCPMAAHVSYNHTITVANKERWHHAGGLRWKTLVDGRKPVQDEVNGRVHSLSVLLNRGYLRRIQLGHSGWERLNGEAHRKCDSSSGTYLTSSPHSTLVHSAWRSCGIGDSWPGYAFIEVGCRDLYWEGTAYDRRCLPGGLHTVKVKMVQARVT